MPSTTPPSPWCRNRTRRTRTSLFSPLRPSTRKPRRFPFRPGSRMVAPRHSACANTVCLGTHACETMGFVPPHGPCNAAFFPPPDRTDTPSPFAPMASSAVTTTLNPDALRVSPRAPAGFSPASSPELRRHVAAHGVVVPLPVRPLGNDTYEILAWPQVWDAARACALQAVPVTVMEGLSDPHAEALVAQHYPRTPAEPLDPIAQARRFKAELERLRKTSPRPYRLLSALTGYRRTYLSHAIRLLILPRQGAPPHPFRRAPAPPRALPRHRPGRRGPDCLRPRNSRPGPLRHPGRGPRPRLSRRPAGRTHPRGDGPEYAWQRSRYRAPRAGGERPHRLPDRDRRAQHHPSLQLPGRARRAPAPAACAAALRASRPARTSGEAPGSRRRAASALREARSSVLETGEGIWRVSRDT